MAIKDRSINKTQHNNYFLYMNAWTTTYVITQHLCLMDKVVLFLFDKGLKDLSYC